MIITPHSSWKIIDSSKLTEYATCPRKFFYRYILGWTLDAPAHDLYFGTCWHIAREYQLLHGYDKYYEAYEAFETEYRKTFAPETDELYLPKVPAGVLNALKTFAEQRADDLIFNHVVELDGVKMTEISGTVPISEKRKLYYRMDSIMERVEDGMIFSWDHKSTKAKSIKYDAWSNQFFLGIQNGTYTHCLFCLFPIERVLGVEFCGTGFDYLKRGSSLRPAGYYAELKRVPAYKNPDQMNTWLWLVHDMLDDIDRDMDRLDHATEDDSVLMAFRLNPESCTKYFGCPYHDYCQAWQNPLRNSHTPPLGFRQEYWDPRDIKSTVHKDIGRNF